MKKYYVGIDLGTSSLKALAVTKKGECINAKAYYEENTPYGWKKALKQALGELFLHLSPSMIAAIGFSSQVGTYVTDSGEVIGWNSSAGKEELDEIKEKISQDEFLKEIDMPHPDIISYPLPRLCYIKKNYPDCKRVVMPKELLIKELTGELATDTFSQRGIANTKSGEYSEALLDKLGLDFELAPIKKPTDLAGYVTEKAENEYGLKKGTKVYLGCNDFFAGLIGMGIAESDKVFDLSGTSEHIGKISDALEIGDFVSGRYFEGYIAYGGTKASGVSSTFAIENFGLDGLSADLVLKNPPIFLPYLKGERAPIYDENAKGVFFGITDKTDKNLMAYSVLEGIVFSLYDIAQSLSVEKAKELICGGGSANDMVMAKIKAELFNCDIVGVLNNETSALGAAMLAGVGAGEFKDLKQAAEAIVKYKTITEPDGSLREILLKRFAIYKSLYANLKQTFADFSNL